MHVNGIAITETYDDVANSFRFCTCGALLGAMSIDEQTRSGSDARKMLAIKGVR